MTREQKAQIVSELQEQFAASEAIIVCNYKGLNVKSLEGLRNTAREAGVSVRVIKNTLAGIALNSASKSGLELKDTNIFLWSQDQLVATKVAAKFAEANAEFFQIKTAFIDGEVAPVSKVVALSKMPSRNELLAMLLQVWNAPIQNFTIGLNALREKKENEAA